MAKHIITLEVDSGKLFDTLHSLQRDGASDWTAPFGDRMASLLMTPNDIGAIEQVGLAIYGIEVKQVATEST